MPSRWSNLPDGEVFTCPFDINGTIIVDGAIGDYFGGYNPSDNHLKLEINLSRVTGIETADAKLQAELRKYIRQDKNANRIGEFAIGTNIGLKEFVGKMVQDEKFPGVHIAVGNSYQEMTGAPFPSKAHCDFVIKNTNIIVDGRAIMENGRFLI